MSRPLTVNRFRTTAQGLVPAPGTATGLFLRDDGTWAAAGGSSGGNLTPDNHPASANAMDDEFEASSLDVKWSWGNQAGTTATLGQGACTLAPPVNNSDIHSIEQPLPAGTWRFRTKLFHYFAGQFNAVGIVLREAATGKLIRYCLVDSVTAVDFQIDEFNSYTSFASTLTNGAVQNLASAHVTASSFFNVQALYLEIEKTASTYVFRISSSGYDAQFQFAFSSAINGWFTTAADHIGLFALSQNTVNSPLPAFDWFRRMA